MRNWKRLLAVAVPIFCLAILAHGDTVSAAKAKKVTVKSIRKSVVTVKYKKAKGIRRIVLTAKKTGSATVTVKCRMKNKKTKTYRYKVKVVKGKKITELDKAKKAFKIQNQYRQAKGIKALEWSDELYKFCRYRLKTSGFDGHKNLGRDTNSYFGIYTKSRVLMFSENMYSGSGNVLSAMAAWKKSSSHYKNLLSADHVCGAIACYKNVWCPCLCSCLAANIVRKNMTA